MLSRLYIKNFALIDSLDIDFDEGFSVVTGETGAGKSIILGALGLLLGNRADLKSVKEGESKCVVEAHFVMTDSSFLQFLNENDIDTFCGECILRREINVSGKGRAFVNDTPVSLQTLRETSLRLVDIHSQHQNLQLKDNSFQLSVVDTIAACIPLRDKYEKSFLAFSLARKELEDTRREIDANRRNIEFMRLEYKELEDLNATMGEEETLDAQSRTMQHTEEIKRALYETDDNLGDETLGVLMRLHRSLAALSGIEEVYPKAKDLRRRLDEAYIDLKELSSDIANELSQVEYDPDEMERINNRLDYIYTIEKKHGVNSIKELLDIKERIKIELDRSDNSEELLAQLEQRVREEEVKCQTLAQELSNERQSAVKIIEKEMARRLQQLDMKNVEFRVNIQEKELSLSGKDRVDFLFSANVGSPLRTISEVASGGEIARVMLALKAMLSGATRWPTIIFDEIDTGVSGKVAEQMALTMKEMARQDHQVISITHLPQIAAAGDVHYLVYKTLDNDTMSTKMRRLNKDERVKEIAQMLSGNKISEAAVNNARHLLKIRTFIISILLLLAPVALWAQSAAVQKAAKSVFTLTTYKADGSILSTTHGVYFSAPNEGISSFKPFVGASRATILDASGKSSEVETIIGANEMYDICRFRLSQSNGVLLPTCQTTASGQVWAVEYSTKKADIVPLTINSSEQFLEHYNYYIINEEINEDIEGCPILTDGGELIGLVQQSGTSYAIHSTDARYYADLNSSGLSAYDAVFQKTNIRTNLPADREQARLMLMTLTPATDSLHMVQTTSDYIAKYPEDIDGYSIMATYEAQHGNFARASSLMETAIKKVKDKQEAYYEYAKLIYNSVLYSEDDEGKWTLDLAEENVEKAIALDNQPIYRHLLARIIFSKGDYEEALKMFEELTKSPLSNSEIYYEIAQCKNNLGESQEDVFAAIEKAVEVCPTPLTSLSAPYILARGVMLDEMEEYKRALADYNLYDSLMAYRADADFYYLKARCEVNLRQFQQAINDYSHAVILSPSQVTYLAELAALQLRVAQYEEALKACELSFYITTDYPDIYVVQGLALHQLGRDSEAREAWNKATELGDQRGEEYIEKYKLK